MKKIYLAGPGVFRQDARSYGDDLKALCAEYGYEGLYPLDNEVPAHLKGRAKAEWICGMNLVQIRKADLVMADLNDFRGPGEPDSGTAFEIGYANALNKPVWGYVQDNLSMIGRIQIEKDVEGVSYDDQGFAIEDFDLPVNLMLACSAQIVYGTFTDCLKAIAAFETAYGVRDLE